MIKSSVARRYAKALFEALDAKSVEPTRTGLSILAETLSKSSALRHVLVSPAFELQGKQALVTELSRRLRCPTVVNTFLSQLVKKNRIGLLSEIADAFTVLVDQSKGTQQVIVASATALPPTEQKKLRSRLGQLLQREVDLTFETQPRLLAGLQLRIGSTVFDSTARSRLTAMQALLVKE
ncbi:MAG: ATP synthase F1 subunit delta [Nitrospiraceae bacterium]